MCVRQFIHILISFVCFMGAESLSVIIKIIKRKNIYRIYPFWWTFRQGPLILCLPQWTVILFLEYLWFSFSQVFLRIFSYFRYIYTRYVKTVHPPTPGRCIHLAPGLVSVGHRTTEVEVLDWGHSLSSNLSGTSLRLHQVPSDLPWESTLASILYKCTEQTTW